MHKKLLIPSNLDIDNLLKNCDLKFKPLGITSEGLAYICSSIISMKMRYKNDYLKRKFRQGYVSLSSSILKKVFPNYKSYINFLITNNVINCDNHFIRGEKCYGYNFTNKYLGTGFENYDISKKLSFKLDEIANKFKRENPVLLKIQKRRRFLADILLSPLFKINAEAAIKDMDENYSRNKFIEKKDNANGYFEADEVIDQIEDNKDIFRQLIRIVNNKAFEPVTDLSGFRFHSPITRLPKFLRKHLTYDGKSLVSLDLKNSQPYFSLLLLQKSFYRKNKKKGALTLREVDHELYGLLEAVNYVGEHQEPTITLHKILETLTSTTHLSFKKYTNDVVNGTLYDQFVRVNIFDARYKDARSEVKLNFLKLLYDKPSNSNWTKGYIRAYEMPFAVFNLLKSTKTGLYKRRRNYGVKNPIPNIVKILDNEDIQIKKGVPNIVAYPYQPNRPIDKNKPVYEDILVDKGYAKLATLLQRIESHLLLDIACKKVVELNDKIPIISIHDSVITTEEYIDLVETTIIETLNGYIGYPPKLEKEYWKLHEEVAIDH